MGSPPTLDPTPTQPPDTDPALEGRADLLDHLQSRPPSVATSSVTGPSTRSLTASAVTWTPATATTTPA
jgi:hypothetical protein